MSTNVGSIYYDVTLDTAKMIRGQRDVDASLKKTAASLDTFQSRLSSVAVAIGSLSSALYVVGRIDAFTKLNAQLQLATNSTREFNIAQAQVKAIAQEAQTSIEGVANLYARISTSTRQLGIDQQQVANITRTVALALKVSGASAQESASATLQLSQAFASGVLRGEEFNAVNEAAPRLMQALADGMGVARGALRGLAEDGKLTSDVLAMAIPQALNDIEAEAGSIQTIGGAFQELKNELTLFVGEAASASGTVKLLTGGIGALASNIDLLTAATLGFAATKMAQFIAASSGVAIKFTGDMYANAAAMVAARNAAIAKAAADIEATRAQIVSLEATKAAILTAREQYVAELALMNGFRARGLEMTKIGVVTTELAILGRQQASVSAQQAVATNALAAAESRLATATASAAASAGLASRALGLLGGPIGIITTVLGIGVTAWAMWGNEAEGASEQAADAMAQSHESIMSDLNEQIKKLERRNALAAGGGPGASSGMAEKTGLDELTKKVDMIKSGKMPEEAKNLTGAAKDEYVRVIVTQYAQRYAAVQKLEELEKERQGIESKNLKSLSGDGKGSTKAVKAPKLDQESFDLFDAQVKAYVENQKMLNDAIDDAMDEAGRGNDARLARKADVVQQVDPVAALQVEYEGKLAVVQEYEQLMAAAGVDAAAQAAIARGEIDLAYEEQKRILDEERFARQSEGNAFLIDSLNALEGTATNALSGLLTGAMDGKQAMSALASTILDESIKSLVQMGVQYVKNSVIQQAAIASTTAAQVASTATMATTSVAAAGTVAAAAAPAAGLMSIATLGNAALIGGAALIGTMALAKSFGGGRRYGGPTNAGSMYRVNESGRPEMFTASNGNQYMMPTSNGRVTSADKVGGGGGWTVVINNNGSPVDASVQSVDESSRVVTMAINEVARQIHENTGPVFKAMRASTNTRGVL